MKVGVLPWDSPASDHRVDCGGACGQARELKSVHTRILRTFVERTLWGIKVGFFTQKITFPPIWVEENRVRFQSEREISLPDKALYGQAQVWFADDYYRV